MDNRLILARKYHESGLPDAAWQVVREILADTADVEVLSLAASLRLDMGALADVLDLTGRILVQRPGGSPHVLLNAHLYRAQALLRMGRSGDAQISYQAALGVQAHNGAAWNNLGNLLDEDGRPAEARRAFEQALRDAPDFSLAHNNLGATLAGQGEFAAAAAAHRKALACDPANVAAYVNLGVALLEQGLVDDAIAAFDAVLARDPANRAAADNRLYAMLYTTQDPRAVYMAHAAWGKSQGETPRFAPQPKADARRLRIGYVSPDFRRHSVSFFFEPLLAAHHAHAVETFCYSDAPHADDVTARLRGVAHHWRDVAGLNDDALLARIVADGIDILVDLAGHSKGNRLAVFARRAAPLQISALGYPATTGLATMDYRLCDAVTDPPLLADACAVERLVRLPALHCFRPAADAPAVTLLPAATTPITFGAFNKLAKISPATVQLWAAILKAVPAARLILKAKPLVEAATRQRVLAGFGAAGIAPERIELLGWRPGDRAHLESYNTVDIALDTFPYNGTTTTCEALWMGVPVLTLAGEGHAARVGASLLTQVGLADWIAATPEDFIAKAAAFAGDVPALAVLRAGLRSRMAAGSLCDAKTYARAVEAAYGRLWATAELRDSSAG